MSAPEQPSEFERAATVIRKAKGPGDVAELSDAIVDRYEAGAFTKQEADELYLLLLMRVRELYPGMARKKVPW